ncbi:hypothetical protein [Actinophytocola sp.]|uniref:hypothetical protein n=1 Tax=Actinophytocola sp. TaxID=1872138 RepID=UPI002ED392D4
MSSGFARGFPVGYEDVDVLELAGYTAGLSAGLAKALADVDDADLTAAARGGFVAVPAGRVRDGATVVEHPMAEAEGVAILDVRLPAGLVLLRHAGNRPEVVGLRLAAVRIGLTRRLLDHAMEQPRRDRVLLRGIADVVSALEPLRHQLVSMTQHPPRAAVAEVHARLDGLGWQVARLFWPDGYRADHPVRALFVAELVANTWLGT